MALIKCNSCGHMISDKATRCPKCGCPNDGQNVAEASGNEIFVTSATPAEPVYYYEVDDDNNNKKWLWAVIVVLVLVILGGGGYYVYSQNKGGDMENIQKFAINFADKVSKNHVESIRAVYPDAAKIDSFALNFIPDKITVKELPEKNLFEVELENGSSFLFKKVEGDESSMQVIKSYGLMALPDGRYDFALKTGWIEKGMTDVEMAERFQDKEFEKSLQKEFIKDIKSKVSVKITGTWGDDYFEGEWVSAKGAVITVSNNSAITIHGDSYHVTYSTWYWGDSSQKKRETLSGKDIAAGGIATLQTSKLGPDMESEHSVQINFMEAAFNSMFLQSYKPTGNEYKAYLAKKSK